MPDTEIPQDVIEAMSLLRLHARKNKLPPNDNNFEDAANLLERQALQLADRASRAPDPSRAGLVEAVEAAWSQFINCRGDPSGDKAEDEAEEQRNVLALSAAIQALAPSVVAEPTPPRVYCDICSSPNPCKDECQSPPYRTPSPHKGEPDVLRDAVAILKRLSILRIPPYDLPADSFLEKAATEIITLVIAAPPPMEGMVLVPRELLDRALNKWAMSGTFLAVRGCQEAFDELSALAATPNHPEPGADHDRD